MNRSILLTLSCVTLFGAPLIGQTKSGEVAKLRLRVQELEAENQQLKQVIARKDIGSLGVPLGRIVTVTGYLDPDAHPRSIHDYRVTSVDGQKVPGVVRVLLKTSDWARSKGTPGKAPLRLKGFLCTAPVGDPLGMTALAFHLTEVFMIVEVLDEK